MNNPRRNQIIHLLDHKGEVQLSHLRDMFPEVSEMTLRRDLIFLEKEGIVVRTYGGAVSTKRLVMSVDGENVYSRMSAENMPAKIKIAQKALHLVEKGRSIYFDSGTTLMCLAEILPDDNYSIITNGADIALELIKKVKVSVTVLGGQMNRNTLSMSGPRIAESLDSMNIDLAFMSASGFSARNGFTVADIYECELKRKIVGRAGKVIMLLDTGKINKNLPFTYAGLEDADVWISEKELPGSILEEAEKYNVSVI